jgi:hypothetical protein
MTRPLLTISAFARAVDLAPSTLRYYDECGLLPPTEVDARTGYRYYTPRPRPAGAPGPAPERGFADSAAETQVLYLAFTSQEPHPPRRDRS